MYKSEVSDTLSNNSIYSDLLGISLLKKEESVMELKNKKYCIVGLGMEGGSYAMAIKEKIAPIAIYGIDKNPDTLKKAQFSGVIVNIPIEEILQDTDVLIMAIYPKDIVDFLKKNQEFLRPGTIITDVAGVKSFIIENIRTFLRSDVDYIAGHPMAGNQYMGFDNADINIFKDKNYILIPQEQNKDENIAFIEKLALAIGCKRISKIDMISHDKKIAYASHMMHFISVCVTNSPTFQSSLDELAGGSFKDLTRISDINPYLWTETFFYNKEFLLEELEHFKKNLDILTKSLKDDDYDKVFDFLERSRRRKSRKS